MTREEVLDKHYKRLNSINDSVQAYKDYLSVLKAFFGEDFPMIKKFETLISRFEKMAIDQLNEIVRSYVELDD